MSTNAASPTIPIKWTEAYSGEQLKKKKKQDEIFKEWLEHMKVQSDRSPDPTQPETDTPPLKNKPFYRQNQRW